MNNLLLNFLFGDRILDSIDAEIYLSSINKFKSFKKLICVNNVSEANIERLKKYYDYVVGSGVHGQTIIVKNPSSCKGEFYSCKDVPCRCRES